MAMTPAQLIALVNAQITANGAAAITGPILNNVLQQIITLLALAYTLPEPIAVTGTNTLANLSNTPTGTSMFLFINGQALFSGTPNPAFSFSGPVLTWNAANAGYVLTAPNPPSVQGDKAIAWYPY